MRPSVRVDRLSGVDVRAAIRRTRLPFVASLFLAALLGAPAVAPPAAEPAPVTVAAAAHSTSANEPETTVAEPLAAEPAVTLIIEAPAATMPASPALRDQAIRAALAPRAPPRAARG